MFSCWLSGLHLDEPKMQEPIESQKHKVSKSQDPALAEPAGQACPEITNVPALWTNKHGSMAKPSRLLSDGASSCRSQSTMMPKQTGLKSKEVSALMTLPFLLPGAISDDQYLR